MTTDYVGFFGFPENDSNDLAELHRQWRESLDGNQDDYLVRRNKVYRRALRGAVCHAVLADGHIREAFAEVIGGILQWAWHDRNQGIFVADDCRALADKVAALEKRSSEAKVIARIARRAPDLPAELLGRIYRAFKEVLFAAARQQAGFTWAVLSEGAEEELARRRQNSEERQDRQDSEDREDAAKKPATPSPLTPEEIDRRMRAYNERMLIRELEEKSQDDRGVVTAWLCLLPADSLPEVRARLAAAARQARQALAAAGDSDQAKKRAAQVLAAAREHALSRSTHTAHLRRRGEFWALDRLHRILAERRPRAVMATGAYSPAQAGKLAELLAGWAHEQGGEKAALRRLAAETDTPHRLVASAYRKLEKHLAAAADKNFALVWLIDERARIFQLVMSEEARRG